MLSVILAFANRVLVADLYLVADEDVREGFRELEPDILVSEF